MYLFLLALPMLVSGCSASGSYEYHSAYRSGSGWRSYGSSTGYTPRRIYNPPAPTDDQTVETEQRASTADNGLTDEQQRALKNLAMVTVTTLASDSLMESESVVDNAVGVGLRLWRASFISDAIKQAFPTLTDFENRTATRVAGLILNGKLTPENLAEQTVRGEIVVQLGKNGETIKQEAQVANFLYLLYQARH